MCPLPPSILYCLQMTPHQVYIIHIVHAEIQVGTRSRWNYEHLIVSAVAGRDYSATSAPLEFPAGVANGAMQCVNVTVYNDKILEYDEFFLVQLSIVTFDVWEENTVTTITILNNNDACESLTIRGKLGEGEGREDGGRGGEGGWGEGRGGRMGGGDGREDGGGEGVRGWEEGERRGKDEWTDRRMKGWMETA